MNWKGLGLTGERIQLMAQVTEDIGLLDLPQQSP